MFRDDPSLLERAINYLKRGRPGIRIASERKDNRRYVRGDAHPNSKINSEMVAALRQAYAAGDVSYAGLGARYEIDKGTVGKIVRGERWRSIAQTEHRVVPGGE